MLSEGQALKSLQIEDLWWYVHRTLSAFSIANNCWHPLGFFFFFCASGDICSTALPASKANIQKKSKHRVQIPQHESHPSAPAIQQWTQATALVTGEFALISQVIIHLLKNLENILKCVVFNHSLLQMWCRMKLETLLPFGLHKKFLDYNPDLPGHSNCGFHRIGVKGRFSCILVFKFKTLFTNHFY